MIENKYHYEGNDKQGKSIIIDAAFVDDKYEVMAFRPHSGAEIACERVETIENAAKVYAAMLNTYALKDGEKPPLKGKYAKLRDDLRAALLIAEQAAENIEDSGTCNMDAASLNLPRWRSALVEQAAKEAGTHCFDWSIFGGRRYVFSTPNVGQARRNEVAAEAMTEELARRGYEAFCYQQMD